MSLHDSRRPRIGLADLEHYDEPAPEDAAELDDQVWAHIDSLLVGFADECDDDDEERIAEADRLEDARIGDDDDDVFDDDFPDEPDAEDLAQEAYERGEPAPDESPRRCRVCGCTDDDCLQCIRKTGEPCHWVEADLCSACSTPASDEHDQVVLPIAAPTPGPAAPTGPLAGVLEQLAFGWGLATSDLPASRHLRPDRTRPGDAPGWKGGDS